MTIRDFTAYYHNAIARRARRAYTDAIAAGRTAEEAADAQIVNGVTDPVALYRPLEHAPQYRHMLSLVVRGNDEALAELS